jgi:hypothetical protein
MDSRGGIADIASGVFADGLHIDLRPQADAAHYGSREPRTAGNT